MTGLTHEEIIDALPEDIAVTVLTTLDRLSLVKKHLALFAVNQELGASRFFSVRAATAGCAGDLRVIREQIKKVGMV